MFYNYYDVWGSCPLPGAYGNSFGGEEMKEANRKYRFEWELLGGNFTEARPFLGAITNLEVYRLFQFTLRDLLEQRFGTEVADDLFRSAGVMAGRAFFAKYLSSAKDVGELASMIQSRFREMAIGIVRFEDVDLDNMTFQLTVDEDLDCSGLPDTNDQICVYDEGLIKGILEAFTGKEFTVNEIDCWCSGERTCRFKAVLSNKTAASN